MKKMHTLWLCVLALCLWAPGALALDGQVLVQENCTSCHSLQRVQQAFGHKNQDAWAATVARMLAKPDAPVVTHAEHGAMVDWLTAQQKSQTKNNAPTKKNKIKSEPNGVEIQ